MAKNRSPSRLRYEKRNPTISARVPKEFKEQLQAHLDRTGTSFSEWIQASFKSDNQVIIDTDGVWNKGYTEGYDRGVFDVLLHLFQEGWTDKVQELEYGFMHLDEEVDIDDWLTAMSAFTRHVKARFPEH